jgi:hypothetical protein
MTRPAWPTRAPSVVSRLRLPRRLRGWLRRYLPAELSGTASALVAAELALMASHSLAVAALCGSIGETAGYYAASIVRDVTAHYRLHLGHDARRRFGLTCLTSLRSLLIEFGPAEAVDGAFVRPYLLWVSPQIVGQAQIGWLAAKLAADAVFYTLAVAGHEFHQRRFMKPDSERPAP